MKNQNYANRSVTSFNGNPVFASDFYYTDPHTAIPRGELFSCSGELTLAQSETKFCQLKMGDKIGLFYGINLQSNATALTVEIAEAPTITDGTQALTAINYNRNSENTAQFVVYTNPTNVSGGTVIKTFIQYANPQARSTTTMAVNSLFHILKPNTSYSIKFVNGDNNQRKIFASFVMMEVEA